MNLELLSDMLTQLTPLRVQAERCVRVRSKRATCDRCMRACPVDGIRIDGGIDILRCTYCGACVSVCPTEAFTMLGFTETELVDRLSALPQELTWVLFYCERARSRLPGRVRRWGIKVGCLAGLTESLLLFSAALGKQIFILRPSDLCKGCDNERALPMASGAIARVERLLSGLGPSIQVVERLPKGLSPGLSAGAEPALELNRRQFLGEVVQGLKQLPVRLLTGVSGEGQSEDPERPKGPAITAKRPVSKRAVYMQALQGLVDKGLAMTSAVALRHIEASRCYFCGVCARLCPTEAIVQEGEEEGASLKFFPSRCTNCGLCLEICLQDGLHWGREMEVSDILRGRAQEIAVASRYRCERCGNDYVAGPSDPGRCISCALVGTGEV